ncbi:recombinase [Acetoanaerobium noterae]|uniref:recombinase n=1 Tax=Acetoanaerobium noterae TaxID=745369 RepID=UPI0028AAA472|nr:recombinase [Acetoanaerobium noterae]
MCHTPFGYRIENGKAVIDSKTTEQIRILFQSYLSGDSLDNSAIKAGINSFHAGIGRILQNAHYLGDKYYPAIIDQETFAAAEVERLKRTEKLGRIREPKEETKVVFPTAFHIKEGTQPFDDPFQQAEYAYSFIVMEIDANGSQ